MTQLPHRGVGVDGLLLDVAHETVASLGADDVREEESVEHHALADEHHKTEDRARLLQLQECQKVHPLVLRLLQQGVDPTVIPTIFSFSFYFIWGEGGYSTSFGGGFIKEDKNRRYARRRDKKVVVVEDSDKGWRGVRRWRLRVRRKHCLRYLVKKENVEHGGYIILYTGLGYRAIRWSSREALVRGEGGGG